MGVLGSRELGGEGAQQKGNAAENLRPALPLKTQALLSAGRRRGPALSDDHGQDRPTPCSVPGTALSAPRASSRLTPSTASEAATR